MSASTVSGNKSLKGRMRRLSIGANPSNTNKVERKSNIKGISNKNVKKRDPRVARKRLSISNADGMNQSLLDGIKHKQRNYSIDEKADSNNSPNKRDINNNNKSSSNSTKKYEITDYNHVEIHSDISENHNLYKQWSLKSEVGLVPFNPNKVNQDRGLIIESIQNNNNICFFGVFDGHGMHGDDVSQYLIHKFPKLIEKQKILIKDPNKGLEDLFSSVTKALKKSKVNCTFSGSTAITVYMNDKYYFGANAGDSRAVLGRLDSNGKIKAIPLSYDHKPDNKEEQKRIERKNGRVEPCKGPLGEFIGPSRVWLKHQDMPGLAMSRSFGDDVATSVGVHSVPDIIKETRTNKDKFIVLGSDGVFEFLTNQEVCDIVSKFQGDSMTAAKALVAESAKRWQAEEEVIDDTTALVIFL